MNSSLFKMADKCSFFFVLCFISLVWNMTCTNSSLSCNNGNSSSVSCNEKECNVESGKCFCKTKGTIGDQCEACDTRNNYHLNEHNGLCTYELATNYQYTFNLSRDTDRHFSRIAYKSSQVNPDYDIDLTLFCSESALVNVSVKVKDEQLLHENQNCSTEPLKFKFLESDFDLGVRDGVPKTTFNVYIYEFKTPIWIQISLAQYPKLKLSNLLPFWPKN